jgi:YD repeat-containing protein
MTYDALSRLETVTNVNTGRTMRYEYDAVGNRVAVTVTPATRPPAIRRTRAASWRA